MQNESYSFKGHWCEIYNYLKTSYILSDIKSNTVHLKFKTFGNVSGSTKSHVLKFNELVDRICKLAAAEPSIFHCHQFAQFLDYHKIARYAAASCLSKS